MDGKSLTLRQQGEITMEEIILTPEMEAELSNGRGEDEDE